MTRLTTRILLALMAISVGTASLAQIRSTDRVFEIADGADGFILQLIWVLEGANCEFEATVSFESVNGNRIISDQTMRLSPGTHWASMQIPFVPTDRDQRETIIARIRANEFKAVGNDSCRILLGSSTVNSKSNESKVRYSGLSMYEWITDEIS